MLSGFLFAACFGVLNRARGSKLFEQTDSTTIGRLASSLGMAYLTMLASQLAGWEGYRLLLWTWASIYLWSLPGWGKYAGAAIGSPLALATEKEFFLVDWVMAHIPVQFGRAWGGMAMSLRMLLAAPCVIGVAYLTGGNPLWALLTPLMGWAYWVSGHVFRSSPWAKGEYLSGIVLGTLVFLAI